MSGLWKFLVRVQSWYEEIQSDPVMICKIFKSSVRSGPDLPIQNHAFLFCLMNENTAAAIVLSAKYDCLKAK